jgi:hypothetical protein
MATIDATRANAALWEHYVEQQYGNLLTTIGLPAMTGLLGTAIATYYVAFWGDVIARLFATNAGEVTRFVQQSGANVQPRFSATPLPPTALDEPPPWLREAMDEINRRREEPSVAAPTGSELVGAI